MIDDSNPRSLIYQFRQLNDYLGKLPRRETTAIGLPTEVKLIVKSLKDIQLADLELLAELDSETKIRHKLEALMTEITAQLEQFTSLLSDKYFDHTAGPQQVVKALWKTDL